MFKRVFAYFFLFFLLLFSYSLFAQDVTLPESVSKGLSEDIKLGNEYEQKADYNQSSFHFHKAGNTCWTYGLSEKAITYFQKALIMSEKLGNLNGMYVLNTNIGLIYSDLGDYQKALSSFTEASKIAERMGRKYDIASSLLNKANVMYELGQYNETIEVLQKVNAYSQELNDPKLLRNSYSLLTKAYDKIGKREESAKYFDLFAAITRKIQQDEILRKEEEAKQLVSKAETRVLEVEAQKEAKEKELLEKDIELMQKQRFLERAEQESRERLMRIELLSKESELQQAIIRQQNLMRNIYLVVIITTLIIAGLIYYFYRDKKRANLILQQKNEEISRQNIEIQTQAEQLRELNQLKDKLFSIISHDLRSPLGSLITLLNLTKQGYFTEEGFKDIVKELSTNVGYTSTLLENLLAWAQSQMSGIVVNKKNFSLFDIVDSKIHLYKDSFRSKNIKIINKVDKSVMLYADMDMIDLVIRNLIANAIKFTRESGEILIETRFVKNEIEVCVSDSGVGISKENMNKLFGKEIFSTQGTASEKGTGLGLILCKDFIQLNGGKIWAESLAGTGSKFFFTALQGEPVSDELSKPVRKEIVN